MKILFGILLLLTALALVHSGATKTETKDCDCSADKEAVLLSEIKELVFLKGATTKSRREPAISQLECVGGSAQGAHEPNSIRCVNTGSTEPHWRCEATLEDSLLLGTCTVGCEGYRSSSDPYVLRDSCGLSYHLEHAHWAPYLWGKAMRALTILIWTPLKWLSYLALTALVGLVVLTLVRRPAIRARHAHAQDKTPTKSKRQTAEKTYDDDEDEDEDQDQDEEDEIEYEEEEDTVWSGRLRPKKSPAGRAGR